MDVQKFLKPAEAAAILGVTLHVLVMWRHRKYGPRFFRMNGPRGRGVRYLAADLIKWMESHAVDASPCASE